MNLKYLLETYDMYNIANHMQETYPEQEEGCFMEYIFVLEQLKDTEHIPNDMVIHIECVDKDFDGTPCEEPYWNIYGREPDNDDTWALDFMPWGKWLKAEMDPECSELDDLDLICHCLWEMTFHGWTEATIKEVIEELDRCVEDIKSGKEKGISLGSTEEMREFFDELIDKVKKEE